MAQLLLPLTTKPSLVGHAEAIRLAVTPVFLLAGIGGLLGALPSRMARIVDRARWEQGMLRRRMRLVSRAIGRTTFCYLPVALVVALLREVQLGDLGLALY
jgi:hypothetical protein